jgi:ABC-type multidrug transport system ATPase subunit
MKQRLGIAAALLPNPELLILDEPTNGLDPAGIVEMRGLIRSFADDGMTVLVSSHLISEIEQVCDYVVMIRGGRLVHQGPMADLQATQTPDIVIAPEYDTDLEQLAKILEASGHSVTTNPGDQRAGHRHRRRPALAAATRPGERPHLRPHPRGVHAGRCRVRHRRSADGE